MGNNRNESGTPVIAPAKWAIASEQDGYLGTYEGTTPEDALDAMSKDAGYRNHAHACEVTGSDVDAWWVKNGKILLGVRR